MTSHTFAEVLLEILLYFLTLANLYLTPINNKKVKSIQQWAIHYIINMYHYEENTSKLFVKISTPTHEAALAMRYTFQYFARSVGTSCHELLPYFIKTLKVVLSTTIHPRNIIYTAMDDNSLSKHSPLFTKL